MKENKNLEKELAELATQQNKRTRADERKRVAEMINRMMSVSHAQPAVCERCCLQKVVQILEQSQHEAKD